MFSCFSGDGSKKGGVGGSRKGKEVMVEEEVVSKEKLMRAVVVKDGGGRAEDFEVQLRPIPEPKKGEIRIRVTFTGVNRVDIHLRKFFAHVTAESPYRRCLSILVQDTDFLP